MAKGLTKTTLFYENQCIVDEFLSAYGNLVTDLKFVLKDDNYKKAIHICKCEKFKKTNFTFQHIDFPAFEKEFELHKQVNKRKEKKTLELHFDRN